MTDFRSNRHEFLQELESLGVEEVRRRLPSGVYGDVGTPAREVTEEWLASKESERKTVMERRSEGREEQALSEASKANVFAREANVIARDANVLAEKANSSAREANDFSRESNTIAREANTSARRANQIAIIAMIISAIATIIAIVMGGSSP